MAASIELGTSLRAASTRAAAQEANVRLHETAQQQALPEQEHQEAIRRKEELLQKETAAAKRATAAAESALQKRRQAAASSSASAASTFTATTSMSEPPLLSHLPTGFQHVSRQERSFPELLKEIQTQTRANMSAKMTKEQGPSLARMEWKLAYATHSHQPPFVAGASWLDFQMYFLVQPDGRTPGSIALTPDLLYAATSSKYTCQSHTHTHTHTRTHTRTHTHTHTPLSCQL
jgi:hypothetical protein